MERSIKDDIPAYKRIQRECEIKAKTIKVLNKDKVKGFFFDVSGRDQYFLAEDGSWRRVK